MRTDTMKWEVGSSMMCHSGKNEFMHNSKYSFFISICSFYWKHNIFDVSRMRLILGCK